VRQAPPLIGVDPRPVPLIADIADIADIAENGEVTTEAERKTRLVADFTATNGRDELTADGG